jgi:hypothetical protein
MELIPFARAFMGGQVPRDSGSFSPRHLLRRYYKNCYLFFILCPSFLGGSYFTIQELITILNLYSQRVGSSILLQNASREMVGG